MQKIKLATLYAMKRRMLVPTTILFLVMFHNQLILLFVVIISRNRFMLLWTKMFMKINNTVLVFIAFV